MLLIRPIQDRDLDALMEMLEHAGHGLTSLPKDPVVLKRRIKTSIRSFSEEEITKPAGEDYLFIMEDLFTGELVGVSSIVSKIGGFEPFYFYRHEETECHSESLGRTKKFTTLHCEKIHAGPSEICSLFLTPKSRNSKNGRLLSLSRFLYAANDLTRFEKQVIAEMRGRVDESGYSPFYEAVGKKFFDIEFTDADYLSMKSKSFIEELLPDFPIIVDLLPKAARDVVGQVHPNTEPAKSILEKEGFVSSGLVGIFEPGPVLKADLAQVRAVKESKTAIVTEILEKVDGDISIISTTQTDIEFKACMGPIELNDDKVKINQVTATALKVRIGDTIRYVDFRPKF